MAAEQRAGNLKGLPAVGLLSKGSHSAFKRPSHFLISGRPAEAALPQSKPQRSRWATGAIKGSGGEVDSSDFKWHNLLVNFS